MRLIEQSVADRCLWAGLGLIRLNSSLGAPSALDQVTVIAGR